MIDDKCFVCFGDDNLIPSPCSCKTLRIHSECLEILKHDSQECKACHTEYPITFAEVIDYLQRHDDDCPPNNQYTRFISNITDQAQLIEIVSWNPYALQCVQHQTPEICLAAVHDNWKAILHVKDQTPEICIAAVEQNGEALKYVQHQSPEICLAAVEENGWALRYVKDQIPEICLAAVQNNLHALKLVDHLTVELCQAAVESYLQRSEARWS